jgi:hypothetical protein
MQPMAVSDAVAAALTGPRRAVRVEAVTPHAVYLATGDPDCPALCLADRAAIRVPCALVVDRVPALAVGDRGEAGDGELRLSGFHGRVARWWRPPRPRRVSAALLSMEPFTAAPLDVGALLGRGPGLTPFGDDVLAGALVTLGARGAPAFEPLAAEVRALAPTRTTFVSAALLHHAARGECVAELAAFLTGTGTVDALLAVGHTSGAGLAQGVRAALS